MKTKSNVEMIEVVAKGLGALKEKAVFVGGATVSLYLTEKPSATIRPTDDVDCVVEITSRQNYYDLIAVLEKNGFKHTIEERAPICRMDFSGLKVDIMPSDPRILGFSNVWYEEGIKNSIEKKLPNGDTIQIFSLAYFIAAKIEAYFGRGRKDFRLSSDIEDIVAVLEGQKDFKAMLTAPTAVKGYLKKNFRAFVTDPLFLEALAAHLDPGPFKEKTAEKLLDQINSFLVGE